MAAKSVPKKISGTSPTTVAGAASLGSAFGLSAFDSLVIIAELVGATGGALDVYLQTTFDEGTTWYDYAHFTQIADGGTARIYRIAPALTNDIATIGKGSTVALAAGTCVGGHWGDQMRVWCVPGATTTAGAAQTVKIYGTHARN